jgi:predicted DNA repair protein MutK
MPSGLVALLDDVAGLTKLAAASLDDVGAAAGKAGTKAAGVVVDDTAVTPRYVTGLSPQRELPIIFKIALGSLRNKLLLLLPAAMLLSAFAPWAITPLLMAGGAYLCFEGAEKVIEHFEGEAAHEEDEGAGLDPAELEACKVKGAIRTDLILSAEIMAIALAEVASSPFVSRALILALVGAGITVAVYGVVALIVKMDDIGLHLAERKAAATRALGRGLVKGMPLVMELLSTVGTAAMIWVGGGILVHGLEVLGLPAVAHFIPHLAESAGHAASGVGPVVEWLVGALGAGLFGLAIGGAIALTLHTLRHRRHARP